MSVSLAASARVPRKREVPQYADTPILMYQCGPSRKEWRP